MRELIHCIKITISAYRHAEEMESAKELREISPFWRGYYEGQMDLANRIEDIVKEYE